MNLTLDSGERFFLVVQQGRQCRQRSTRTTERTTEHTTEHTYGRQSRPKSPVSHSFFGEKLLLLCNEEILLLCNEEKIRLSTDIFVFLKNMRRHIGAEETFFIYESLYLIK